MQSVQPPGVTAYIRALVPSASLLGQDEIEHPLTNFLRTVEGNHKRGTDLLDAQEYEALLALWQPIAESEYCDPTHAEWSDKPFYRTLARIASMQLFYAHAQLLIHGDYEFHTTRAFQILSTLIRDASLVETAQRDESLGVTGALAQDENLNDLFRFAIEWFDRFGGKLFAAFGVDEGSALEVRRLIIVRQQALAEIIRAIRTAT